jgi:thiosulfate/3-mercaptopyruvate sulfurtransferase
VPERQAPRISGSPVVSPAWLHEHLEASSLRVAQIQYEPDEDDYTDGHIPGARWWYWKDILWHPTDREFTTPARVAERLGAAGISADSTLVLYSGRAHYAMHAYWVLHEMLGHRDVRVLDGGKARWMLEGRPLTTVLPEVNPVEYRPARTERDDTSRVTRDDVRLYLGKPGRCLIDARTPEEFRGERLKPLPGYDHGAERRGHIPGAVNLHGRDLLDPVDFTLKPRAELERIFRAVGAAPDQADEVVAYCRLSHRASSVWFVMTEVLGWNHVRVYDGSWTEWGSIVGVPVER